MIYVPIFKVRTEEMLVSKKMNYCFSDNIIPLFEILKDQYKTRYQVDPITQEYIYEQGNKRKKRIKEEPTEKDIITLDYISNLINNKNAFIDYFRFTIEEYEKNMGSKKIKNVDISKMQLAWKLSRNTTLYIEHECNVSKYENLIPTISVKSYFAFKKDQLQKLLLNLQEKSKSIALRLTEEFLDEYCDLIKDTFRETDYLLFDIREQNPISKFMELDEVRKLKFKGKKILLNSPRKASINNGDYEEQGVTELIDNCAREEYINYDFHGFGDYCGLKDELPTRGNTAGKGAALALLYNYNDNSFYSFLNPDTKQGISGYKKIIPLILSKKHFFDPINSCPAIQKIETMRKEGRCGNWRSWHNINMTRYLHQIYYNMQQSNQ